MYLLGIDIGSSSVKASILSIETGEAVASAFSPEVEMEMIAEQAGWAEQHPDMWVENAIAALQKIKNNTDVDLMQIQAIGISYQMHGLVVIDEAGEVLRPSIIWCDSRAVEIGNKAFNDLGADFCLSNLLNSPGNFTASKLKWVRDNEEGVYSKVYKAMLPGDYFSYKLTGEINTTASGLSEGMMWNFKESKVASKLLEYYGISESLLPPPVDTFSIQGLVTTKAAKEFGIPSGIPVAYRAGDQPNNAFSLNVLKPGEIAATAGTSGVVYGVTDQIKYDPKSRVNTFLHVNNTDTEQRLGVLLCINSTGILNSWLRKNVAENMSYEQMNTEAEKAPIGSEGLLFFPFGNGAERVLENKETGAQLDGLNFNIHNKAHMLRAAQEGIVFAFVYGMEIMQKTGIETHVIKAGKANMFLSPIFRNTLAGVTGATIELYDTDGSIGAARGAGIGSGLYKSFDEAFEKLQKVDEIKVPEAEQIAYKTAYKAWKEKLESIL
ncbi:MAG: FGGY family carbohydrate kinase [Salinivirgaceae bacterium]|jgi:xylulokinase|nr:FGGY family carbohydrate kinase [Salinivirgaceae bacterium]